MPRSDSILYLEAKALEKFRRGGQLLLAKKTKNRQELLGSASGKAFSRKAGWTSLENGRERQKKVDDHPEAVCGAKT